MLAMLVQSIVSQGRLHVVLYPALCKQYRVQVGLSLSLRVVACVFEIEIRMVSLVGWD